MITITNDNYKCEILNIYLQRIFLRDSQLKLYRYCSFTEKKISLKLKLGNLICKQENYNLRKILVLI